MKILRTASAILILTAIISACTSRSAANQPELEGSSWVLVAYNQIDPIEGAQVTLHFEGGQVSGNGGCNSYSGSYQQDGGAINFGPISQTEIGCTDPEGVLDQERTYLQILGSAQTFELAEDILTIFSGRGDTLTFQVPGSTVSAMPVADHPDPTETPDAVTPAGFWEYQDSIAGVSIHVPESWIATGVIMGEYAILQSYHEGKYVGGEPLAPGDTKCDLNLRSSGTSAAELVQQWKSNSLTTILSEEEIILDSGSPAIRIEIDSMGLSTAVVTEINGKVVSLTCFGDSDQFDAVATTLKAVE